MNPTSQFGEICWSELATNDVKTAKDFYGNLFGWEFKDNNMDGMTYTEIKSNNKVFGGIWGIPKEMQQHIPPHWMSYVLVENVDTSLEKAMTNGCSVKKEATNVGDFGRFAVIQDPTGAHIALWQMLRAK